MSILTQHAAWRGMAFGVCLLAAGASCAALTEVYLRAAVTTNVMPDGAPVLMWGFARDTGPGSADGSVSVPGPPITLAGDDQHLHVYLTNTLAAPVSLVIPGQSASLGNPARNLDGRVRSFTYEAPPGGVALFVWSNLQAGTYIYHSGSHPALQVQMGLYGALVKTAGPGAAYPAVPVDHDRTLFFSAIDPAIHAAVANDEYGPGKEISSTLEYRPRYFLINGASYTNGLPPVPAGRPGERVLLRLLNAGLDYHIPVVNDATDQIVAEDGQPLAFPREAPAVMLPPLKTMDVLLNAGQSNLYALYDRRLGLVDAAGQAGGMLTYLDVTGTPVGTAAPFVDITNAVPQYEIVPLANIYGFNNSDTVGGLSVSNATSGGAVEPFAWGDAVALGPGLNTIVVYGTNLYGATASDSHDVTYDAPPFVDITNAPVTVAHDVSSATIGRTSVFCVGQISFTCYSNTIGGDVVDSGSIAAAPVWQLTVNNLAPGANVVEVIGTNDVGVQSYDTLTITRQMPPYDPSGITQFSISLSGGVVQLTWSNGLAGVLACTNRYYSTDPADWFVLAGDVNTPWLHTAASNYASIYYRLAAGIYTSQYDVGAFTLAIKQSDGVLFRENWVSSPLEFLDSSGNVVPVKSFDELDVAACLSNETGLLSRRDRIQSQDPIGGNTFTASRGNGVWFVDAPSATNWHANKMYLILINPLHTGADKPLTFVGKVRNATTHTLGGIVQSDGVLPHENWVAYPYPARTSFDQGAVASVLTDQSGLLANRDKVQSQEPVGGDTFTASRGVGTWFYDSPAATNLVGGKGYLFWINPLHTGATTNWIVPKPY